MTTDELEREAHFLGAMAAGGQSIAGMVKGTARRSVAQYWNEWEHRFSGNKSAESASEGEPAELSAKTVLLAADYTLEFGEMTAMSGDYFENVEHMRQLARNKQHKGVGTREELEYVRVVKVLGNKILENNYSQEVINVVEERHHKLAGKNSSHFTNSNGTSLPSGDMMAVATSGNRKAYMTRHRQAIDEAIRAGMWESEAMSWIPRPASAITLQDAMATEAASSHFFTDAFASGHIRTPRNSITEHWNAKVPLFKTNLAGWMAETIAPHVTASLTTKHVDINIPSTEEIRYNGILGLDGAVDTTTKLLEHIPITLGDLISGILHDQDNNEGLQVNQNSQPQTYFGDGMMKKRHDGLCQVAQDQLLDRQTADIEHAVMSSIADIQTAYSLAKEGRKPADIMIDLSPNGHFFTEELWPTSPGSLASFAHDSIEELFANPAFQDGVQLLIAEKAGEISAVVPGEYAQVVEEYILRPLTSDPLATLRLIINWTPGTNGGVLGHNIDDNAMDYYQKATETNDGVCSLTDIQRQRLVKDIGAGKVFKDEKEAKRIIENDRNCQ